VFRDEEDLPADNDLNHSIRVALEQSRMLVVICSPRAVASRYVAEEIRHFKELGRTDRILALIIDGEPCVVGHAHNQSAGRNPSIHFAWHSGNRSDFTAARREREVMFVDKNPTHPVCCNLYGDAEVRPVVEFIAYPGSRCHKEESTHEDQ